MSLDFSDPTKKAMEDIVARYPHKEAALLPILHLAQQEFGYISADAEKAVAAFLDISPVKVHEVVSFYTMYHRSQVGKYHIQMCANLSCSLLGAESLVDYVSQKLGINPGETTAEGTFTLSTVQCLGACEQAPCMMVNLDYYGNLDTGKIDEILDGLK